MCVHRCFIWDAVSVQARSILATPVGAVSAVKCRIYFVRIHGAFSLPPDVAQQPHYVPALFAPKNSQIVLQVFSAKRHERFGVQMPLSTEISVARFSKRCQSRGSYRIAIKKCRPRSSIETLPTLLPAFFWVRFGPMASDCACRIEASLVVNSLSLLEFAVVGSRGVICFFYKIRLFKPAQMLVPQLGLQGFLCRIV